MTDHEISYRRTYLLSNGISKKIHELEKGDSLSGDIPGIVVDQVTRTGTKVYLVKQYPFADNYCLCSGEYITLALVRLPKIVPIDNGYSVAGFMKTSKPDDKTKIIFTIYENVFLICRDFVTKDEAMRFSKDMMSPGEKIHIPVDVFYDLNAKLKDCFGGYFSPAEFIVKEQINLPFDPKDVAYLTPKHPGPKFLKGNKRVREKVLESYISVFATNITEEGELVTFTSRDRTILKNICLLSKSLGNLSCYIDEYTVMINMKKIHGMPSTAYPIEVIDLGFMESYCIKTNKSGNVLLQDFTVSRVSPR